MFFFCSSHLWAFDVPGVACTLWAASGNGGCGVGTKCGPAVAGNGSSGWGDMAEDDSPQMFVALLVWVLYLASDGQCLLLKL